MIFFSTKIENFYKYFKVKNNVNLFDYFGCLKMTDNKFKKIKLEINPNKFVIYILCQQSLEFLRLLYKDDPIKCISNSITSFLMLKNYIISKNSFSYS